MNRLPDGVAVSRETWDRLQAFADLLRRWNERVNLVSRPDLAHLWERHVADSLQLLPLLPPRCQQAVDLGSGAGFPGLILALASGVAFTLIESDRRKATFLREAIRTTGANATVLARRIEAVDLPRVPLVTARALAPLPRLLPLAAAFLASDGICLFPKGANAEQELTAARREWHMDLTRVPSQTHRDGVILRLSRLRRV